MTTVHKQRLAATDTQTLSLPLNAEVLCVHEQHGEICVWYRCDETVKATQSVQIALCGTGHPAPNAWDAKYVGTAFLHGGSLVLHAFVRLA